MVPIGGPISWFLVVKIICLLNMFIAVIHEKGEVKGSWENSPSSLPICSAGVVAALPELRCGTGGPLEGLVACCTFPS